MSNQLTEQQMLDNIQNECKIRNIEFLNLVNYSTPRLTKIQLKCIVYGHIWTVSYANFMYAKRGCPICTGKK